MPKLCNRNDIHKLVFPGTYRIRLHKCNYQGWVLWVWKSKWNGFVESTPEVSGIGPAGQHLPIELLPGTGPMFNEDYRKGTVRFWIPVAHEGIYEITGNGKCILVLSPTRVQDGFVSPLSVLLSGLFHKLAWEHTDMRELDQYFRTAKLGSSGQGHARQYPIDFYSEEVRSGIRAGRLVNGRQFDEWSMGF